MEYCDLRKLRRATSADGGRVDTSYSLDGLPVAMELYADGATCPPGIWYSVSHLRARAAGDAYRR